MKSKFRFVAFLLALLMTGSLLVSCGETAENSEENLPDSAVQSNSVTENPEAVPEEEETRPPLSLDVSTLDFGGEELVSAVYNWQGYLSYFFADEYTGDSMNDAIYSRRIKTEEALNISMRTDRYSELDYISQIKKLFMAGDHAFDLMFNHCIQDIATYVSEGYLYNLDLLPNIDTQAQWWDREQMDNLRLGKNTYYAVNDMMIPAPYLITFNKDMITDNHLDSPYQLVYEGRWTLDAFTSLAKSVVRDLDGNGEMDKNDQWGFIKGGSANLSFMVGAGQFLTGRDADNRVILTMNTEKMQSLVEIFADLSATATYFSPSGDDRMILNDGKSLFDMISLGVAEQLRDYDVNVGILPYPKYDEAQAEYMNMDWGGLLSVSGLITNPDMVGAAMEFLAWDSANEVIPAYFDLLLAGKLARDEDDRKMLDLIFETIVYDNGANYFGFSQGVEPLFYTLMRLAIEQQSTDYASHYAANEKMANKSIETFYKKLEKIEG